MRWPFKKRSRELGEDLEDAIRQAARALQDAHRLRSRADEVTGRLTATWARNGFTKAVAETILKGKPT